MLDQLILLHAHGAHRSEDARALINRGETSLPDGVWIPWVTCMRSILIGASTENDSLTWDSSRVDAYRGADAYRFCLEVVCGLHSSLVGETEVMGQFKEIVRTFQTHKKDTAHSPALNRFFHDLLADAKSVRHGFLKNLGSQSYGSLTRKFLKTSRSIHVLGAGHLAEELLPWLKDFASVEVFCRSPEKRKALTTLHPKLKLWSLEDEEHSHADGNALIVAASMSAQEITAWMERHGHVFDCLLDLRGDARKDPIPGPGVIRLDDFFAEVKGNQVKIRSRVEDAIQEIRKLSEMRFQESARTMDHRPFGWDDICA